MRLRIALFQLVGNCIGNPMHDARRRCVYGSCFPVGGASGRIPFRLALGLLPLFWVVRQIQELPVQLFQLFVREPIQIDHIITRPIERPDQLIELEVQRFPVAILGILNQEHHQEGDDGGAGIDHQLPGI